MYRKTGFGSSTCILCTSAHYHCSNCIYSFRKEEDYNIPCKENILFLFKVEIQKEFLIFNSLIMKIEFYSTFPEYVETENSGHYYYAFSILPTICVDNRQIWFHWLFWGISFEK